MTRLILFNKPYGVACQFRPMPAHPGLKDYIPLKDVYPAGRLDADSEGLVILTDDGSLQHRISHPRHKLDKSYWAQVEGIPSPEALLNLERGVDLGDFVTRPARACAAGEPSWLWPRTPPIRQRRHIPTSWVELTICEGKNRQVRRMTAAVGHPTLRLIRYRIGEWTIANLQVGEWRAVKAPAT